MFHLFNKVYLDFDHNISVHNARVVFSKEYAAQCEDNFGKTQYYFSTSVKQSIGKKLDFNTYVEFFERCSEIQQLDNRPLIIYCDKDSFLSLFVAWHKVIFKEISFESLHKILYLYLEKEKYYDAITHENNHVHTEYFDELLNDKKGFNYFYENVIVKSDSNFVNKIAFDLGIEYIMSSYLYVKSQQFQEMLSKKLLLLIKRTTQGEIYEVKSDLVFHSQDFRIKKMLGLGHDATSEEVLRHEIFSVLTEPSLWKKRKLMPSDSDTAIDLSSISYEITKKIQQAALIFRRDFQGHIESSDAFVKFKWIDYLIDNSITKDELEELIMTENFTAIEISDPSDINHLNILFIDWCLGLYRDGKQETLADYVLNL